MSDDRLPRPAPTSRRRFGTATLLIVAAMAALSGCRPDAPPPPRGQDKQSSQQANDAARTRSCDQMIETILEALDFDQIGRVDADTQASDLNAWARSCGGEVGDLAGDDEVIRRTFPGPLAEQALRPDYASADALHVRDALFSRAVANQITAPTNLAVAVAAMRLVSEHLLYLDPKNGSTGLAIPELWLIGVATPDDRARAFIEVLRQRRLDALVLEMPAGGGFPAYTLVGVPIDGDVFLFDPTIGMGVPADAGETPLPQRPLTLAAGLESDDPFRRLDNPLRKYPVSALRLKTARVYAAADPLLVAPRMAVLQDAMPASRGVTLYEGLSENTFAERGLTSRLAAASGRDAASLSPWPFLVARAAGRIRSTRDLQQLLAFRDQVLLGPYRQVTMYDEDGQPRAAIVSSAPEQDSILRDLEEQAEDARQAAEQEDDPTVAVEEPRGRRELVKTLARGRAFHVVGRPKEAFQTYLRSRAVSLDDMRNTVGAADAAFWVALGQAQRGDTKVAEQSFRRFLNSEGSDFWMPSAVRVFATLLAEDGRLEEAVRVVEKPLTDPSLLLLGQRWRQQAGMPSLEEEAKAREEATTRQEKANAAADQESGSDPPPDTGSNETATEEPADMTEESSDGGQDSAADKPSANEPVANEPANDEPASAAASSSDEPAAESDDNPPTAGEEPRADRPSTEAPEDQPEPAPADTPAPSSDEPESPRS